MNRRSFFFRGLCSILGLSGLLREAEAVANHVWPPILDTVPEARACFVRLLNGEVRYINAVAVHECPLVIYGKKEDDILIFVDEDGACNQSFLLSEVASYGTGHFSSPDPSTLP